MDDVCMDCPRCDGTIWFEVQTIADGHEENTASYRRHEGGDARCPLRDGDVRQGDAAYQEVRVLAAMEFVMSQGW